MSSIKKDVNGLKKDVAELKDTVAMLATQINRLEERMIRVEDIVSSLQKQDAERTQKIDHIHIKVDVVQLRERTTALESQIHQGNLSAVEYLDLKKRVQALERKGEQL